jgi:hypothetical protein
MEIVDNIEELKQYMETAARVNKDHPVLVDKYLMGKEIEVDAVCDGQEVLIPGIMQHIERAGVHSGDSTAVFPAHDICPEIRDKVVDYTTRLALELEVRGLINIQFVEHENELYVLEVNPRSSRTIPFVSKVTGIPMVKLATEIMLGKTLKDLGYHGGLYPDQGFYAVKVPVFSFSKLQQVDINLGPEMKSTGEVMGIDYSLQSAIYKGLLAAGVEIPEAGSIVATIADKDKDEAIPLLAELAEMGFNIIATEGTARALSQKGVKVQTVKKIKEGSPNIVDLIREGKVDFVVNTLTHGRSCNYAVPGMYSYRVQVFHGTNGNTVIVGIPHYLELDFFVAGYTSFDQNLLNGAALKTPINCIDKFFFIATTASAGSPQGIGRAHYERISYLICKFKSLTYRMHYGTLGYGFIDLLHGILEQLPVLSPINGLQGHAQDRNSLFLKNTGFIQSQGHIQPYLTAQVGNNPIRSFFFQYFHYTLQSYGLHINCVGNIHVGHNSSRIAIK